MVRPNSSKFQASIIKLLTGDQLTDPVVNYFLELLCERDHSFTFLDSLLLDKFRHCGILKNISLVGKKFLFMPVCDSNHWFLIVANLPSSQLFYYDSTKYESQTKGLKIANEVKVAMNKLTQTKWSVIRGASPQQKNMTDCGVFMLVTAELLSRSHKLDFNQAHIWAFRLQIFNQIGLKEAKKKLNEMLNHQG